MSRFENSRKNSFLSELNNFPSIDSPENDLTKRCKFNFSYFDASQKAGQDFKDWTHKQLIDLLEKLKAYSQRSLNHWARERVGSSGLTVFATYPNFPQRSEFKEPTKTIPYQVLWSRFRLGNKIRLIGFVVPPEYHKKVHSTTGEFFDKNTFYVVFLDRDHKFYKTENR